MTPEHFICSCGPFKKSMYVATATEAFVRFGAYVRMSAELTQNAKTIVVRGPVRTRHQTAECVFDRSTGALLTSTSLQPAPRRGG